MQLGRGPKFRRLKNKPITLKPKIVRKEIHGQMVAVKVYPAQYAQGEREEFKRLGLK
jgi:hypothetical protein